VNGSASTARSLRASGPILAFASHCRGHFGECWKSKDRRQI